MPSSLPGATTAQNGGNPSQGACVLYDLMSGPKGSPFDRDQTGNQSTGALSTGIGFGSPPVIGAVSAAVAPQAIKDAGFSDDYTPGVTKPDGTASANSTLMYIGGGREQLVPAVTGVMTVTPYTAGFGIGMAGNGASRDAGAGPAFTGFLTKMVTATAGIATGAAIETNWLNRSGAAMVAGQSTFGSGSAASAVPAMTELPSEDATLRAMGHDPRDDVHPDVYIPGTHEPRKDDLARKDQVSKEIGEKNKVQRDQAQRDDPHKDQLHREHPSKDVEDVTPKDKDAHKEVKDTGKDDTVKATGTTKSNKEK